MDNVLYPPIFYQSFMPAFTSELGGKIYFGLSSFNFITTIEDLRVLITIDNQKTNKSAFSKTIAPIGIYDAGTIIQDKSKTTKDRYYIQIPIDENNITYDLNTYYKVQLRFIANTKKLVKITNTTITTNLEKLSEWSTAVLIRRISSPVITVQNMGTDSNSVTHWTTKNVIVQGEVSFKNAKETERIKSYQIKLYDEDQKNLFEDSKKIYLDNYKKNMELYYAFKHDFETNTVYSVEIILTTQEEFTYNEIYYFTIDEILIEDTLFENIEIESIKDEEGGRIGIHVYKDQAQNRNAHFIIKRTSSKSNFEQWEEVYYYSNPLFSIIDFTWFDTTVEAGVYYLYGIQRVLDDFKTKSQLLSLRNPIRLDFENILLTTKDRQLKIKYNGEISNITSNIIEAKVETLGGKYPIITRKGSTNYKSMTISGLITFLMDVRENSMKSSPQDLYGELSSLYKEDDELRNLSIYNNPVRERDFRQLVINFLQENNIKILRTLQEGNLLVKLMDIVVTPMNEMNNYLYSFSCTAVEVDDFNFENLKKYNLIDFGQFIVYDSYIRDFLIEFRMPSRNIYSINYDNKEYEKRAPIASGLKRFPSGDLLNNRYVKTALRDLYVEDIEGKDPRQNNIIIQELNYLKIELDNPPYSIVKENNELVGVVSGSNTEKTLVGHLVKINQNKKGNTFPVMVIGKNGTLELSGPDVSVNYLEFPTLSTDGKSSIETGSLIMQGVVQIKLDKLRIPKAYYAFFKIGQLQGSFASGESLVQNIYKKYNNDYSYQEGEKEKEKIWSNKVQQIRNMRFYAPVGTIVYVKEAQDTAIEKHIIGVTQFLEFFSDRTNITEAYFNGIHFEELKNENVEPQEYQFIKTKTSATDFNALKTKLGSAGPKKNRVYKVNNVDYIYYKNEYIQFPSSHELTDILINAYVDYSCIVFREVYE